MSPRKKKDVKVLLAEAEKATWQNNARYVADHTEQIRSNLAWTAEQQELKPQDIAKYAKLDPDTIRGFIKGSTMSGINTVLAICEVLEVTLCEVDQPQVNFRTHYRKTRLGKS